MATSKFDLIISMVDAGFTDLVMNAAVEAGARGGTVIHARGTGRKDMEEKYGVVITPDKEVVMIVAQHSITDDVLKAIYKGAGLDTKGHGIAFTVPIGDVTGLKL